MQPQSFAARLLGWHAEHGRHDLPWQTNREPYRVWLSEIMLQQTQVATVRGYYARFLARFPTVAALAAAPLDEVMPYWAGLGYYARARNLHACARAVMAEHGGSFPRTAAELAALPGIGRSTAAAIAAFCFGERSAILDGNVKRVLARHAGIDGYPGAAAVERRLWSLADTLLPAAAQMPAYTQALMDLGATVCTARAPRCDACPLRADCLARLHGRTAQLPTPRPARVARTRHTHWLLVLHTDRVLLEQRAGSGLWGGLWVPPEYDARHDLERAADALGRGELQPLPARRHAFTHYTLEYAPVLLRLQRLAPIVEEPRNRRWWILAQAVHAAVPTPVRAILHELSAAAITPPAPSRPALQD